MAEQIFQSAWQTIVQLSGLPSTPALASGLSEKLSEVHTIVFLIGVGAILYQIWGLANKAIITISETLTETAPHVEGISGGTAKMATGLEEMLKKYDNFLTLEKARKAREESKPKLDIPKPPKFSGKAEDVETFIQAVETYLDSKNEYEATARIRYMVALVNETEKDKTRNWASIEYRKMTEYKKKWLEAKEAQKTDLTFTDPEGYYQSWEDFINQFRKYFCLLPNKETAKKQLKQLHMGKNTCDWYTGMFNSYAEATGYGDEWALDQYKAGLNPKLRLRVATQLAARPAEQKKVPPTLQEWKDAAMEVDREWRTEREYRSKPQQKVKVVYRDAPQTAKREEKDPDAMDVDAIQTKQSSGTQNGKCFICKEKGHPARACPKAKCGICQQLGHTTRACPKHPDSGSSNIRATTKGEGSEEDFS
ncbi:hypothetical protein CC2G_013232 [Coprinopsis cinerea AmutBmut pab1-1]|nr:hypothetical protein CC2G_013232 [Coprinopsis cinerea AmutBmut pab1-1]